ncbi:MAG: hypothetical protein VR70_08070 [Rhodospirillaceae bacterium BRH_c57]|nr:MAG: hypothetical protein VR70_08070 [Rhodospirillaceae bacterium BRH_c57]
MTRYITITDPSSPMPYYPQDDAWLWHLMLFPEQEEKTDSTDVQTVKLNNKYRVEALWRHRQGFLRDRLDEELNASGPNASTIRATITKEEVTSFQHIRHSEDDWQELIQKRQNQGYMIAHLFHYMIGVLNHPKDAFRKKFAKLDQWRVDLGHHLADIGHGRAPQPKGTDKLRASGQEATTDARRIFAPAAHLWAAYYSPDREAGSHLNHRDLALFLARAESYRHLANRLKAWEKVYADLDDATTGQALMQAAPPYRVTRLARLSDENGHSWVERVFHKPLSPAPFHTPSNPEIQAFLKEKGA